MRSSSGRSRVPFPAPEVPVMTMTGIAALPVEEPNKLRALAVREPAHGLRLADPTEVEEARRLDAAELRDGEQHVEHLGRRDEVGRFAEDVLDTGAAALQILLQLRAPHPDVVRPLERFHALVERSDGGLGLGLGRHGWRGILPAKPPGKKGKIGSFSRAFHAVTLDPGSTVSDARCEAPRACEGSVKPCAAASAASSARILAGASGSPKRTVPRATWLAPAAISSSASRPVVTPPIPTIGRSTARCALKTAASAIGFSAGPE